MSQPGAQEPFARRAEWFDRHYYQTVRGRVRFQVLREQLKENLPQPPAVILDAGGGPGRMACALAAEGYHVTLLDPSEAMREHAMVNLKPYAGHCRVWDGTVEEASQIFGREVFDVMLLHAVVCYVDDLDQALGGAAAALKHRGVLSILFKNRDALPFRHAAEGRLDEALRVLDDPIDVGKLGIAYRARTRREVEEAALRHGLRLRKAYGVRAFTDLLHNEPEEQDMRKLISLELRAGEREPYRSVSRLLHLVCERA